MQATMARVQSHWGEFLAEDVAVLSAEVSLNLPLPQTETVHRLWLDVFVTKRQRPQTELAFRHR